MAKRKSVRKKSQVGDRLIKGRGNIEAETYVPYLFIHDVPSLGMVSRVSFNGRALHLMSGLETAVAMEACWSPAVLEIYEQVALADFDADPPNVRETEAIAREMGIPHIILADGSPGVFTTDLVIRFADEDGSEKLRAIAVKPLSEVTLTKEQKSKPEDTGVWRTLNKLEVERRFWAKRGVDWFLVTDRDILPQRTKNIALFLKAQQPDVSRLHLGWQERLIACLINPKLGALTIEEVYCERGRLQEFMSLKDLVEAIKWLCKNRRLSFDMNMRFSESAHLFSFTNVEDAASLAELAGAN